MTKIPRILNLILKGVLSKNSKNLVTTKKVIIRNSSLPLLGGRNMTREDKEKHSLFLNFYSINVSEKVLISNKKNTLSI